MNEDGPRLPFARADYLQLPISIKVSEKRVLWIPHFTNCDRRPALSQAADTWIEVHTHQSTLFPRRGDVEQSVSV